MRAGQGVLSLSSDWFSILDSIKDDTPNGDCSRSKGSLQTQTSDHPKPVAIHALLRVSFDLHDLTVLCHRPLVPRKCYWEGNGRPNSVSPDFLQYLCIFLAVKMQRQRCLFWWMSYSLGTDGKQLSILTHLIAFRTKDSWSCAILRKYKAAAYLYIFLKSGSSALSVWRLHTFTGNLTVVTDYSLQSSLNFQSNPLHFHFLFWWRLIHFCKYIPNESEESASVSSEVWFSQKKVQRRK